MASEVGMVARRYQNKFSWIAQKQDKSSNLNAIETYSNHKKLKLKKKYINEHAGSKKIYNRHYLVSFKVCGDAKYQKFTNNSVLEIMWYLSGFQLSHYTEGFCSASPLEEILAYTFSRYPIKSTTARFYQKKEVSFYFFLLYFGIWWIEENTFLVKEKETLAYLIIVTDAIDAVSVNFFGLCKFLQI